MNDQVAVLARAEIDSQIATAKAYPRNPVECKKQILEIATLDEETASQCFYTLPRGGKSIQGPSIRMAEIAATCWGNIAIQTRIIDVVDGGDNPHVVVRGEAVDMQSNVRASMEKRRRITTKRGKAKPDEDDIQLAVNSCSSIAFRDTVFKLVPLAIVKPMMAQIMRVAVGDLKSIAKKRDAVMRGFAQMGVTDKQVCAKLMVKDVSEITSEMLAELVGIGTALRDGELSVEDVFPPEAPPKPKFDEPKQEAQAEPQPESNEPSLGDLLTEAGIEFGDVKEWIRNNAKTIKPEAVDAWESPQDIPEGTAKIIVKNLARIADAVKGGAK